MNRRTTTALVLAAVLEFSTACGSQDCSHLAVHSGIQVQMPPAIKHLVRTIRIDMCQGRHCASTSFPATGQKGVVSSTDAYDVELTALGGGWKPGTITGLTIIGTSRSGRIVLQHAEQFTFTAAYPNGTDCDPVPGLTHSTSVSGADLTG